MDQIYRCFSRPDPALTFGVIKFIQMQHGKNVIERSIAMNGGLISERAPGLQRVLESWLLAPSERALWNPIIGHLEKSLRSDLKESVLSCLVETGLLAHSDHVSGCWSFSLEKPKSLWFGRWYLPAASNGSVEVDGTHINISLSNGTVEHATAQFSYAEELGGFICTKLPIGALELPFVSFGKSHIMQLLPNGVIDDEILPAAHLQAHPNARYFDLQELPLIAPKLEQAGDILRIHAFQYFRWVNAVTKYITPMHLENGELVSGSSSHQWGLLAISNDHRPMALVEMVVHESSHQYFYIAKRLGAVVNGSDERTYYSPVARDERTIDRILLGFHAFANIVRLFQQFVLSGIDEDGYCEERLPNLIVDVEQLHEALRGTSGLTDLGNALWKPLAECLNNRPL